MATPAALTDIMMYCKTGADVTAKPRLAIDTSSAGDQLVLRRLIQDLGLLFFCRCRYYIGRLGAGARSLKQRWRVAPRW